MIIVLIFIGGVVFAIYAYALSSITFVIFSSAYLLLWTIFLKWGSRKMKVLEPGHIYEVSQLDGDDTPLRLVFVNRESGTEHAGTQTQEILRVQINVLSCLIDRTNHCDNCLRWEGNDKIVKAMSEAQRQLRLAILLHEQRVLERKLEKGALDPENIPTGKDGHFHEH